MMYVLSVDMDNPDDDDDDEAGRMVLVDLGTKADCVEKAWVVVATAIRSIRNDFMVPDLIRNRRREQRGGNLLVVMGVGLQQRDACLNGESSIVVKTSHAPAVSDPKIRMKDMLVYLYPYCEFCNHTTTRTRRLLPLATSFGSSTCSCTLGQ
jgi:hypothetical protein